MQTIAQPIFYGLLVEFISLSLSILFRNRPKTALSILGAGTLIAAIVAFFPFKSSPPSAPIPMPTTTVQVSKQSINSTATVIDIPVLSPTPGIGDQLVKLIDDYYSCINIARHDSRTDFKECWDLLSEEYQTNMTDSSNEVGFETFFLHWNNFKLGYALFYCPSSNGYFVDAVYHRYSWNDLSTPESTEKRYVEFSFGLDKNGWRIKNGNASLGKLSPDCDATPRVEKWTPTP